MHKSLAQGSLLLCLAIVSCLFGWIVWPFFSAVLWAAVVAILFFPLQERWRSRFGTHYNLLALSILLLCTVIVILPLLGVTMTLAHEGSQLYEKIQSGDVDLLGYIERSGKLPTPVQDVLDRLGVDIGQLRQTFQDASVQVSRYVGTQVLSIGQNTAQFLISFAMMLYMTFFFLRDGRAIVELIIRALPLGGDKERLLMQRIIDVIGATVRGNLIVAVVQGVLGGLILWVLGVQAPVLWGAMMILASLIPAVGAALIWAPIAIYFLITGAIWQAVVLTAFGAGIIGLVDNVLRPILV